MASFMIFVISDICHNLKLEAIGVAAFGSKYIGELYHIATRRVSYPLPLGPVRRVELCETHHFDKMQLMGIASLHPSYALYDILSSYLVIDFVPKGNGCEVSRKL
jgi:hypothetical protein